MDLVVDDSSLNRDVLTSYLEILGTKTDQASDGAVALSLIKNKSYRIIWLDLKMPKIGGLEFAKIARANGYDGCLVATTGYADLDHQEKCRISGINAVVSKPYTLETIKELIDKMIS